MGVYEESKERLVGLQNKVQRVYDAGEALTKDQSKTARSKFKIMYASLESISNDFETHLTVVIRQQCKGGASGPDGIDTEKERAEFEEKYIGCKILADEHLPESIAEASLNQTFMEKKVPQINIPVEKLPVPHFNGDQKEYTSFRNQFEVLVHNNEVFRPVIKFSYLKAYLEGEPLKLINNLMLSDENYELALNILDKRYSNRRTIAHDHFDQLWTAQKAMLGDSKSIRQLLNTITESVGALKTQKYAVDQWDPILLYLFQKKLDAPLRGQWELLVDTNDDPTVEDFVTFLTKFCKAAGAGQSSASGREKASTTKPDKITTLHTTQSKLKKPKAMHAYANEQKKSFSCQVCKATPGHLFIYCPDFKQKTPAERHQLIKDLNRCYLCFSEHMSVNCKSTRVCEVCGGRHHSWLHLDNIAVEDQSNTLLSSVGNLPIRSQVLMSTVEILIQDANGCYQRARALLDSASESSYITESCRHRLGVSRQKCHLAVSGISGVKVPTIKARAQVVIRPVRHHEQQMTIEAYVVTQITGCTPSKHIRDADWVHLKDLELADPNFNKPLPVDVLLGAEVFPYIIRSGRRENLLSEPVGIETVFGWALMGNTGNTNLRRSTTLLTSLDSVDLVLRRFWEIEEVPNASKTSPAEEECERIYHSTTTRESDGRYVVHLPFNCKPPQLGQSRQMALNRLYRLESRLDKLPQLRQQYNTAMQDYLDSGHMQIVPEATPEPEQAYYTPHQVVIKPDSTTTKVRVVYDASATTSNGKSLNDNLYPGKKLQQDLPGIIIRFRLHEVVVTADIKQMFRQIIVTPTHRQYQRLLYRFQSSEPIQTFEMTTVTFGQRSSPFLAIRTLLQLASDEAGDYSNVQRVLRNDLYVDDVVTGADCVESALQLQQNLIKVLKNGQFELRKWSSNSAKVLDALPKEHRQNQDVAFNGGEIEFTKVLGLKWEPNSDVLTYQHQTNPIQFSKRHILSEIARIYDPIGLLAPVTTHLKKLMKYLWSLGVGWDDPLPQDAMDAWKCYHNELPLIGQVRVRRQVTCTGSTYELHGFCDSSEIAYAAAVYILARRPDGTMHCQLLMGKSKVAPEKKLSIPRLELCGALLLARVITYVHTNLTTLQISRTTAWSDSTVALSWIKTPTSKLKTFVANRVAQIQHMTSPDTWRHVPTVHNPADCASRGLTPGELVNHTMWWTGPDYLKKPEELWPKIDINASDENEKNEHVETKIVTLMTTETMTECPLLHQSDSWPKILRLTSYWLRVRDCLRKKVVPDKAVPPTTMETTNAMWALVHWTQRVFFAEEIENLRNHRKCSIKLRKLAPFLDKQNLLRVGGRLRHSDLPYSEKYPMLLPKDARLTAVLIDYVHRSNCHPGPNAVQNILQQSFWIISVRGVIRKRIHRCIPCFRASPRSPQPFMGNLPRARLDHVRAFNKTGVDFAGPFNVKAALLRKLRITKAYLCVFVCMSTTAVHLELASDLSTPTFMAALDRFLARRGQCSDMYSDCGTNFTGTQRYLSEVHDIISSQSYTRHVTEKQITWHFNPPSAPHMGGMWEAAVKSAKTLLRRVIQDQILTYEELNTILHRVEASLNSRPLGALSSDPHDSTPLTAGHFISMGPPAKIPVPDNGDRPVSVSLRQRWTLVKQIQQHFWQRWQREYLTTLQPRKKWLKIAIDLKVGQLVLIKEPSPALTWKTARIVEVYPGTDTITRVADVKLANGTVLRRPVVKLCPLPLSN